MSIHTSTRGQASARGNRAPFGRRSARQSRSSDVLGRRLVDILCTHGTRARTRMNGPTLETFLRISQQRPGTDPDESTDVRATLAAIRSSDASAASPAAPAARPLGFHRVGSKHRRGMAVVENYELSSWHVPDLSGLHLWCAGGRLYSPTRIRRRLAVYQSACSTCLPPVVYSGVVLLCVRGLRPPPRTTVRLRWLHAPSCFLVTSDPETHCHSLSRGRGAARSRKNTKFYSTAVLEGRTLAYAATAKCHAGCP